MIKSNIDNISKWSKIEIDVVCDHCNLEKSIKFKLYTSYGYKNGEYLCKSCKTKKNNTEKYGVENVFQLESIKHKIRKTNLKKHGVEFITQSNEIKSKIKESISKLNKNAINDKRVKTNLEKWGVENISNNKEIKEKKRKTNFINWGSENNKKSEKFRKDNFKIANHKDYINYIDNGISLFKCINGHNFEIDIDNFIKRTSYNTILCTTCNKIGDNNKSGREIKVYNYIKSLYKGEIIQNYKVNKQEIDIYLPELKIGFEFNCVYWHSSIFKNKEFHINKTNFFNNLGIRIIHIWEDDYDSKIEIIESQIKNLLGLSQKIYARECEIKEVDIKNIKNFMVKNHIQGYSNSKVKIGLYFKNELVCAMSFDKLEGRKKLNEDEWNLSRFCNIIECNVVGGASKLLNYFINKFKPSRIISYADKDWSKGNLYEKLNFQKVYETKPDYKYLVNSKRIHKSNFKKSKTGISEKEILFPKIWDCGKIKYEILIKK